MQTPFEDALNLKTSCKDKQTPLAEFKSYPGLGHGFSPRVGLRGWKDTTGPMDTKVLQDIAAAATRAFGL